MREQYFSNRIGRIEVKGQSFGKIYAESMIINEAFYSCGL